MALASLVLPIVIVASRRRGSRRRRLHILARCRASLGIICRLRVELPLMLEVQCLVTVRLVAASHILVLVGDVVLVFERYVVDEVLSLHEPGTGARTDVRDDAPLTRLSLLACDAGGLLGGNRRGRRPLPYGGMTVSGLPCRVQGLLVVGGVGL